MSGIWILLWVSYLLFGILLLLIVIEDFRHRAVHWWIFPLLGLVLISLEYQNFRIEDVLFNSCFILVQLGMLSLYFSLKERKIVNITQAYLGWGDILLWIVFCLLFSSLNFIFFFVSSLVFVMLFVLARKLTTKSSGMKTIPLAGIQALAMLIVLLINIFSDKISFRNDHWLENILFI